MANRLQSVGTNLDSIFQAYVSGDIVQSTTTNIQNGGTDIKGRYAGRDNKSENASTAVNFRYGGLALNGLFNKINSTYDVTISGTVTYNETAQLPTLSHNPSNTPTQATISGGATNAGTYYPSNFTITLPGNYLPGNYSGTFTINPARPFKVFVQINIAYPGFPGYYDIRVSTFGPTAEFITDYESFQISSMETNGTAYYNFNETYLFYANNPNYETVYGSFSFPGDGGDGGGDRPRFEFEP